MLTSVAMVTMVTMFTLRIKIQVHQRFAARRIPAIRWRMGMMCAASHDAVPGNAERQDDSDRMVDGPQKHFLRDTSNQTPGSINNRYQ